MFWLIFIQNTPKSEHLKMASRAADKSAPLVRNDVEQYKDGIPKVGRIKNSTSTLPGQAKGV
jgi:hypothetical protein